MFYSIILIDLYYLFYILDKTYSIFTVLFLCNMYKILIEIIGWTGSIFVLTAYISLLNRNSKLFAYSNFFNFFGAMFIAINCFYNHAFPSVALNVIWMGIAVVNYIKTRKEKASRLKNNTSSLCKF